MQLRIAGGAALSTVPSTDAVKYVLAVGVTIPRCRVVYW